METLRCDDVAKHGSPVRLNWKLTKLVSLTKMAKSVSGEPTCSKNNKDASRKYKFSSWLGWLSDPFKGCW